MSLVPRPSRPVLISVWLLLMAACSGCSHGPRPDAVVPGSAQSGVASYYGSKFEGRRTANGERYRGGEFSAAHKSLPFGTRIRVTHLRSGRTVECRVNDRGPFKKGRIVDLSRRAAEALGIVSDGLAKVRLEVLAAP
ncbi:MAG: septal ring lytic transglycosylase RlpA family protein [Candidatus Eisenbacteria bacterium]